MGSGGLGENMSVSRSNSANGMVGSREMWYENCTEKGECS